MICTLLKIEHRLGCEDTCKILDINRLFTQSEGGMVVVPGADIVGVGVQVYFVVVGVVVVVSCGGKP